MDWLSRYIVLPVIGVAVIVNVIIAIASPSRRQEGRRRPRRRGSESAEVGGTGDIPDASGLGDSSSEGHSSGGHHHGGFDGGSHSGEGGAGGDFGGDGGGSSH